MLPASYRCKALPNRASRTGAIETTNRASELLAVTTVVFSGHASPARRGDEKAAVAGAAALCESRLAYEERGRHEGRSRSLQKLAQDRYAV